MYDGLMTTYQVISPGTGAFVKEKIPVPDADEVLVKISCCGICGTDYALFSGNSSFIKNSQASYPIRLGHEWSGIVVKTGPDVTDLVSGCKVIGDNYVACGVCPACKEKNYNYCSGRHHVGTINPCWPGAFSEYFLIPRRHIYKIPDNISLEEAALCEPLSVAYGGIRKMSINSESVVVVIGTGSIGMSAAALAIYKGAGNVIVIGRNPVKLEIAKKLGVTGIINSKECNVSEEILKITGGKYADYILECSGNADVIQTMFQIAAQKAMIAAIGFYERKISDFDIDSMVSKEITITGIMGEYGNLEAVLKIMEKNDLKLKNIITDIVSFNDCDKAFQPENTSKIIKTIVKM